MTAAKFNTPGDLFAYAVSYDWSKGHEFNSPQLPRKVLLHRVQEAEIKPKQSGGVQAQMPKRIRS